MFFPNSLLSGSNFCNLFNSMANPHRSSPVQSQMGKGTHQLVSELGLGAVAEGSHEGSPSHGGSGGTTADGGGSQDYEGRITSLENTMGIWSGTILNLSGKVDRLLDLDGKVGDLSDRFARIEKFIEEMASSKKKGENMPLNPNSPDLNHPVQGMGSQNWGSNSPLLNSSMSNNENSSFPPLGNRSMAMVPSGSGLNSSIHRFPASTLGSNQTPPVMHQSNFRSLMSVPEQTPEESIRFLRAIAQKYKGDSKSPEEQLQILAAAAQKYKARRDSQAVEEQFQKPNDDLLSVLCTFPNPLATGHQQVPPQVHEEEDPIVQSVYTNSQLQINPKPPVISTTMSPNEINSVGMDTPQRGNRSMAIGMGSNGPGMYTTAPRLPVMALVTLPSHASLVVGQFLDDECPEDSIKGLIPSVCSLVPVKALVDEGISFQVLVWDPGIQVRFSSTLRQGRFEGEI